MSSAEEESGERDRGLRTFRLVLEYAGSGFEVAAPLGFVEFELLGFDLLADFLGFLQRSRFVFPLCG